MYPTTYSEVDMIDFLQRANNLLENYLSNREEVLTQRAKRIAEMQAYCEAIKKRTALLEKFSKNFFEERQKVRNIAIKSLDSAIDLGDVSIAEIALSILGEEYNKDFFGMMNKIGGVV